MKPPICEVCGTDFRVHKPQANERSGLLRFLDYQPLPDGMVGHPSGLGWFCVSHYQAAARLRHLNMQEAVAHTKDFQKDAASGQQDTLSIGSRPFSHYLITRFNLRMWQDITPTDEWLSHRLDLFEQFCYPSVCGQQNQSFQWLLLFDHETPDAFRQRIRRFALPDNVEVVYMQGFDLRYLIREIARRTPSENTHVITTTLDNDDALAEGYINRIQAEFDGQKFELLNVANGLRYDVVGGKLYRCTVESNPFMTLIEEKNVDQSLMTIAACLPHSTITKRFPNVRNIVSEPLWMQVVHERNLELTNFAGRQRVPLSVLTERFYLKHPHAHIRENANVIRLQNMRARAERVMIDALPDEFKLKLRARLSRYLRQ